MRATRPIRRARKLGAGALSYLVTRMDFIPDWNEGIGVMDDIFVMRVCAGMATTLGLGDISHDAEVDARPPR